MTKTDSPDSLDSFHDRKSLYLELLRGKDPEARAAALAELAGRLDDELAAELCRLLLAWRDVELRLQLFETLAIELDAGGFAGEPGSENEREEEPEETTAHRGLSRRGLGELHGFLQDFYRDAGQPERLRRKALEVAALDPLPWQEEAVRECWARPEAAWRVTALYCMGHLFAADFAEEIAEGLAAPENALRAQAIVAADSRELRSLGPSILRLAADRGHHLEVRLCAIEALPTLRPRGAAPLLARLRAEPAPVGPFAAEALRSLEQNERAEALLDEWKAGETGIEKPPGAAPWPAPRLADPRFL